MLPRNNLLRTAMAAGLLLLFAALTAAPRAAEACVGTAVVVADKSVAPAMSVSPNAFDRVRCHGAGSCRGRRGGGAAGGVDRPALAAADPTPGRRVGWCQHGRLQNEHGYRSNSAPHTPHPQIPLHASATPPPATPAAPPPTRLRARQAGIQQHFDSLAINDYRSNTGSTYSCIDSRGEIDDLVGGREGERGGSAMP
jgi:hypothetical protein